MKFPRRLHLWGHSCSLNTTPIFVILGEKSIYMSFSGHILDTCTIIKTQTKVCSKWCIHNCLVRNNFSPFILPFLYFRTFHQRLFLSTHLPVTLYLFQSASAAAACPWQRASQQVCGRWRRACPQRRNSSAVKTRTRPWAPSPPSLSRPPASAAPAPAAGRATATCTTVTRFTPACLSLLFVNDHKWPENLFTV